MTRNKLVTPVQTQEQTPEQTPAQTPALTPALTPAQTPALTPEQETPARRKLRAIAMLASMDSAAAAELLSDVWTAVQSEVATLDVQAAETITSLASRFPAGQAYIAKSALAAFETSTDYQEARNSIDTELSFIGRRAIAAGARLLLEGQYNVQDQPDGNPTSVLVGWRLAILPISTDLPRAPKRASERKTASESKPTNGRGPSPVTETVMRFLAGKGGTSPNRDVQGHCKGAGLAHFSSPQLAAAGQEWVEYDSCGNKQWQLTLAGDFWVQEHPAGQ